MALSFNLNRITRYLKISILFLNTSIINPIKNLKAGALQLAEGNLSYEFELHRKDEIGDLARSFSEMRDAILNAPAVRCDEVQWSLLGISMAGWNFLVSLGLVAATIITVRQWTKPNPT